MIIKLPSILPVVTFFTTILLIATSATLPLASYRVFAHLDMDRDRIADRRAPMASSGENVYMIWWSNKTGNDEVMFRASTDNGATFSEILNLSNTTEAESEDVNIIAEGNNVYVSWWETNQTSDIPVARISNDAGQTFGPMLMLATNETIGTEGGG